MIRREYDEEASFGKAASNHRPSTTHSYLPTTGTTAQRPSIENIGRPFPASNTAHRWPQRDVREKSENMDRMTYRFGVKRGRKPTHTRCKAAAIGSVLAARSMAAPKLSPFDGDAAAACSIAPTNSAYSPA
jgi:hypothetical protein